MEFVSLVPSMIQTRWRKRGLRPFEISEETLLRRLPIVDVVDGLQHLATRIYLSDVREHARYAGRSHLRQHHVLRGLEDIDADRSQRIALLIEKDAHVVGRVPEVHQPGVVDVDFAREPGGHPGLQEYCR